MVNIKREDQLEESCSDTWLHEWSVQNKDIKREETEKSSSDKQNILPIKKESNYKIETEEVTAKNTVKKEDTRITFLKVTSSKNVANDLIIEENPDAKALSKNGMPKTKQKVTNRWKGNNVRSRNSKKTKVTVGDKETKFTLGQKALQKARVSEVVGNLCEYQCPKCYNTYYNIESLHKHFRITKHGSMSTFGSINYMIKFVAHQCHICSKRIRCERSVISIHVVKRHKYDALKTYCDKFNISTKINARKRQNRGFENCTSTISLTNQSIRTFLFGNLCKFSCNKCNYFCQSWKSMTKHINEKQHGSVLHPRIYLKEGDYHKCFQCHELVLIDKKLIMNHLYHHKITLSEYRRQIPGHESLQTMHLKELKASIQDIPTVRPEQKPVLEPCQLPDTLLTRDVGNITFFKCLICPRTNMAFSNLKQHYKSQHHINRLGYKAEFVTEARYHRCYICDKAVLCDNHFLVYHTRSHKITKAQYIQDHVLKNGNKVFPNFQEYCKSKEMQGKNKSKLGKTGMEVTTEEDDGLILPGMISSESEESDIEG